MLPTTPNENDLILRCCQGDPQAWDELFDRYYDPVAQFVFQYSPLFTREDVEEICQEVFLKVVRMVKSFHGKSTFRTWLFKIAINAARDFIERRGALKRGHGYPQLSLDSSDPNGASIPDVPDAGARPDEMLIKREEMLLIHQAMSRLSDPCREIIELRYFGDLSYEELAAALALNPKTVSSRLSKCIDRLGKIAKSLFSEKKNRAFSV
ncbi:MAG: sigma-70 family RNA polymerase sigma factor [Verrucomicrobiae bacterium]|nr:sigma-70 family RNA polymerase sigma factor [Verrucomicrobiae bacterium]